MPDGVEGGSRGEARGGGEGEDGMASPATCSVIAMANSFTASGPSKGNASACSRVSTPRLAASRITEKSDDAWVVVRMNPQLPDPCRTRNSCLLPNRCRRVMCYSWPIEDPTRLRRATPENRPPANPRHPASCDTRPRSAFSWPARPGHHRSFLQSKHLHR